MTARFFSTLLVSLLALSAYGQSRTSISQDEFQRGQFLDGKFQPFVGLGLGYMNNNNRLNTEGFPFNLKSVGSFFLQPDTVLDRVSDHLPRVIEQLSVGATRARNGRGLSVCRGHGIASSCGARGVF